jgi:hypothetical protein
MPYRDDLYDEWCQQRYKIRDLTDQLAAVTAERDKLRAAVKEVLPTLNCKMFEQLHDRLSAALSQGGA